MADPSAPPPSDATTLHPIGVVRSDVDSLDHAPRQGDEGAPDVWLELRADMREAIQGLAVDDEVLVLTWLHMSKRDQLSTQPRNDPTRTMQGVFSTRSPDRPNPIGLHRVTIKEIDGVRLHAGPCEAVEGTPIIDIKPVLGGLDER